MLQLELGAHPYDETNSSKPWLVASGALIYFLVVLWLQVLRMYQRRRPSKKLVLEDEAVEAATEEGCKIFALCWPQEIQGTILSWAGPSVISHLSSTCKACCSSIWNNPITWSSLVVSLGFSPEQGADIRTLQSKVRRAMYGIDDLCQQSPCKQGRIAVRGDQRILLSSAVRACKGLSFEDGAEIAEQVIGRCLELLVSFNVDDNEARSHAKRLTFIVSTRTDVFCPEQCNKIEAAFSDAMDLHQLLSDVMVAPAESEVFDDPFATHLDGYVSGEEGAHCEAPDLQVPSDSSCQADVDATLDHLISVLRNIVDGDQEPLTGERPLSLT